MKSIDSYEIIPVLKNNFPVKLFKQSATENDKFRMHWHENTELLFFTKGTGVVQSGTQQCPVKKNTLVIINGGELHTIFAHERLEYFVIIIFPSFFRDIDAGQPVFEHLIENDENATAFVKEIFYEYDNKQDGYDMAIKGAMYKFAAYLWRNYRASTLSEKNYTAHLAKLRRVNEIAEYIEENYTENLSLKFFCEKYFLSEYYLCHIFKEEMGISLSAYINGVRIKKAAVMLKCTSLTVTEIAAAAGFGDVNYFCRVFKKLMGISPAKYRALT